MQSLFLFWYARVPSPGNPADEPSRMMALHLMQKLGAVRVEVVPWTLESLHSFNVVSEVSNLSGSA